MNKLHILINYLPVFVAMHILMLCNVCVYMCMQQ